MSVKQNHLCVCPSRAVKQFSFIIEKYFSNYSPSSGFSKSTTFHLLCAGHLYCHGVTSLSRDMQ